MGTLALACSDGRNADQDPGTDQSPSADQGSSADHDPSAGYDLSADQDPSTDHGVAEDGPRSWASESSWGDVHLEAVSDESLQLGEVLGLAVGRHGVVYVLDALQPSVIVLDSLLSPLATVGRRGQGPGEFMFIRNIQVVPGDSLMVFDGQLKRVTVFAEEQYDSMRSTVVPAEVSQLWRMLGPVRNHVAFARPTFYAAGPAPEGDEGRQDVFFVLGETGQSKVSDSVLVAPSPDLLVTRGLGSVALGPHAFGREGFVGMLTDGGFVYVNSDALSVTVFDDRGQRIRSFAYTTVPLPVSSRDLGVEMEKLGPAFARTLRDGAPYTRPPLVGMVVDDQDRIWIGIRGPTEGAPREWAAFEPDGRHVGSVRLPAGLVVHAAARGKLLGVVIDDLDVPRIHLYRTALR